MNLDPYTLYCPMRNFLRKQELNASLLAIHDHAQFQHFGVGLPAYLINLPTGYRNCTRLSDLTQYSLYLWELELLCKEVILNSPDLPTGRSLLDWNYLADAKNKLCEYEDKLAEQCSSKENVLIELFRIAHRQFHWQNRQTLDSISRYWRIFFYKKLRGSVQKYYDLSYEEILAIGMGLFGFYQDKIALHYPPNTTIPGVNKNNIDTFLKHFAIDFESLKLKLKTEQQYNCNFAYSYNSLVAFPLIKKRWEGMDAIVCPIPSYFLDRITRGLYYDIYNLDNFDNLFGEAFQNYVGDIIKVLYKQGEIYPEQPYGIGKMSTDWILADSESLLFIECKTKRITFKAKSELTDTLILESELGKLADSAVQLYKSIRDYKHGKYPHLPFSHNLSVYPLVVTLENWHIFGTRIINSLEEIVEKKIADDLELHEIFHDAPFRVIPVEVFEKVVSLFNSNGIKKICHDITRSKVERTNEIGSYYWKRFNNEMSAFKHPFVNEIENKIDEVIRG